MKNYIEVNGMYYRENTCPKLITLLEKLKRDRTRVVFDFGNKETLTSWNGEYDISGYIGKSTGTKPIPLLIHNSRSLGGGELSTDCVLSVRESKGKRLLYEYKG